MPAITPASIHSIPMTWVSAGRLIEAALNQSSEVDANLPSPYSFIVLSHVANPSIGGNAVSIGGNVVSIGGNAVSNAVNF